MAKYRKKPVVIHAAEWRGNNLPQVLAELGDLPPGRGVRVDGDGLLISTLEGTMRASLEDFIIRGVQGEVYPCKPDIFEATYEPVTTVTHR